MNTIEQNTEPRGHSAPAAERDLAIRWHISLRTLQRRRVAGRVPPWFRIGRTVLYPWDGIRAFEANAVNEGGPQR